MWEDSSSYCIHFLSINKHPVPLVCAEEKAAECQVWTNKYWLMLSQGFWGSQFEGRVFLFIFNVMYMIYTVKTC